MLLEITFEKLATTTGYKIMSDRQTLLRHMSHTEAQVARNDTQHV